MKFKKLKQLITLMVVSVVAAATIAPIGVQAAWVRNQENNWNWIENSTKATEWKQINGIWYYFDTNGNMKTGWIKAADSKWYYLNQDGSVKTGWLKDTDGKWYNLASSGEMRTGWIKDINGKWYNLASDGSMRTGWLKDTDGNWYNLASSGEMRTGWLKDIDGNWYSLASSGAMKTGWIRDTDNKWYFANSSGAMQTGVVEVEEKTYVLGEDGAMLSGNITVGDKTYISDESGAIIGDKPSAENRVFNKDGVPVNVNIPTDTTGDNTSGDNNSVVTIATKEISGITLPKTGEVPVTAISDTTEYTATIEWSGNPENFDANTEYTATITITPKTGYTLTGVPENFFTVEGATATNDADSGIVKVVFPITEGIAPSAPEVTNDDDANTVNGMTEGIEYKLDDSEYVAYDSTTFGALDLSGDHTLLVRYAAQGNIPFSPEVTLTFTTNQE